MTHSWSLCDHLVLVCVHTARNHGHYVVLKAKAATGRAQNCPNPIEAVEHNRDELQLTLLHSGRYVLTGDPQSLAVEPAELAGTCSPMLFIVL